MRGQLVAVLVAALTLAILGSGCGGSTKVDPARDSAKTGDAAHGAEIFVNGTDGNLPCAFCHTMKAAGVLGPFGPDLDQEGREYKSVHLSPREIRKLVLGFLVNGRCNVHVQAGVPIDPSHCMPPGLVKGQDAIDMASYVEQCAAKAGRPGCRPDDSIAAGDKKALTGLHLYRSRGCVSCHSMDGNVAYAPTFKGLAGSKVKLSDGTTATADDAYVIRSIADPDAQVVDGYQKGIMSQRIPPGSVSLAQAKAIVAFIKRLK